MGSHKAGSFLPHFGKARTKLSFPSIPFHVSKSQARIHSPWQRTGHGTGKGGNLSPEQERIKGRWSHENQKRSAGFSTSTYTQARCSHLLWQQIRTSRSWNFFLRIPLCPPPSQITSFPGSKWIRREELQGCCQHQGGDVVMSTCAVIHR